MYNVDFDDKFGICEQHIVWDVNICGNCSKNNDAQVKLLDLGCGELQGCWTAKLVLETGHDKEPPNQLDACGLSILNIMEIVARRHVAVELLGRVLWCD